MVSVPQSHHARDRQISGPSPSRWKQIGLALLVSGFALQLGTLPAEARSSESSITTAWTSAITEAIASHSNVDSNDSIPRRGDPRTR